MKNEIREKFGGRLRIRVSGILFRDDKVLMIKHRGLTSRGYLWSPPGGGAFYQSSLQENLQREFLEETGLEVEVNDFLFINEFHKEPLHAIEFFFRVRHVGGVLIKGNDPELSTEQQMIEEVRFFGIDDFRKENGPQIHSVFRNLQETEEILKMKGYFQNWN